MRSEAISILALEDFVSNLLDMIITQIIHIEIFFTNYIYFRCEDLRYEKLRCG